MSEVHSDMEMDRGHGQGVGPDDVRETIGSLVKTHLGWLSEKIVLEEQADGLTNRMFIVRHGDERAAVRLGRPNPEELGIRRAAEHAAARVVADAGIGAPLVYFCEHSGTMITRFLSGEKWSAEDAGTPDNLRRIASVFRRIHALPPIEFRFDPYRDIRERVHFARQRDLPLPGHIEGLLHRLEAIESARSKPERRMEGFCHNDPFPNNFLYSAETGTLHVLDWEYAGFGDVFFDLACLCTFHDQGQQAAFLAAYLETPVAWHYEALTQMRFVSGFWNAMWAVLQAGLPSEARLNGKKEDQGEACDYAAMAQAIFSGLSVDV